MAEAQITGLLKGTRLEEFTQFTITDQGQLMDEMDRIRSRGYSIDDQEKNVGMRCIAAPVHNWTGHAVAGISISGPVARIEDDAVAGLADAVMQAAPALSAAAMKACPGSQVRQCSPLARPAGPLSSSPCSMASARMAS